MSEKKLFYEGKTKILYIHDNGIIEVAMKDALTFDGYIYELPGIGQLKLQQILATNNLFEDADISSVIIEKHNKTNYLIEKVEPVDVEFMFRIFVPDGSSMGHRIPGLKNNSFKRLFALPTIDLAYKKSLVKDGEAFCIVPEKEAFDYDVRYLDPMIAIGGKNENFWCLYPSKEPLMLGESPLFTIEAPIGISMIERMALKTQRCAIVLKRHLSKKGCILKDGKLEFGISENNNVLLLEPPSLDEIKVEMADGTKISKQVYRELVKKYRQEYADEHYDGDWKKIPKEEFPKVLEMFTEEDNQSILDAYKKGVEILSA